MNDCATISTGTGTASPQPGCEEVRARLGILQDGLMELGPDHPLQQLAATVSQAFERITVEHAGMAEELLCLYEQLGVLFEVTRNLSIVQGEEDVVALFLASLRRSFAGRSVSVDRANSDGTIEGAGEAASCDPWLGAAVQKCIGERKVVVDSPQSTDSEAGLSEAMVGPVVAGDSFVCAIVLSRSKGGDPFRASDMLLLESLSLFCGDLIRVLRLLRELRLMSVATVRALVNAVDQKDKYTYGHSLRVGYFATMLGRAVGLDDADLQMLQWSALLHDVGKIGIRDDVLKKAGRLTDAEFAHIQEHPTRSHSIVQEIPQLRAALDGVLHHHEHYDGGGYPEGLVGKAIPLQARIVQVADVFDALTSHRAYRSAYEWSRALEIIREEAGTITDPELSELFERLVREKLEAYEGGWTEMIENANRFSQISESSDDLREN